MAEILLYSISINSVSAFASENINSIKGGISDSDITIYFFEDLKKTDSNAEEVNYSTQKLLVDSKKRMRKNKSRGLLI